MKDKIINELRGTKREGIEDVIEFMKESDFFSAPASSMHHGCITGGLAIHSYNVMDIMRSLNMPELKALQRFTDDSIILCGLLHDFCKINTYKPNLLKNGSLSTSKPYKVDDKFPIGHGEKSVIMLQKLGLKLTDEEMIGIRYHMNVFDSTGYKDKSRWNDLSILVFIADYFVSTFLEKSGVE